MGTGEVEMERVSMETGGVGIETMGEDLFFFPRRFCEGGAFRGVRLMPRTCPGRWIYDEVISD